MSAARKKADCERFKRKHAHEHECAELVRDLANVRRANGVYQVKRGALWRDLDPPALRGEPVR